MTGTGSKTYLNGHGPVSGRPNGYTSGGLDNGHLKSPTGEKVEPEVKHGCMKRLTNGIVSLLENWFAWLGKLVANHPWKTIAICLVVVGLVGIGFMRFTETTDSDKLWVPEGADVLVYKNWVDSKFPGRTRFVTIIFEANNVLTASVVKTVNTMYKNSLALNTGTKRLSDVCIKAGTYCRVSSILELWSYNDTAISALTDADVQSAVNTAANTENYTSPMYSNDYDITTQVGERVYSGSTLQSAKALKMTYLLQGTDALKEDSKAWEKLAIELAQKGASGVTTYVYATRSFSDLAGESISGDVTYLTAGYFLLIVFVAVILGRFNCTEHRIGLAFCGIIVIGLSICLSFSLASTAGWEYGPLHSILPFLLLGIGVDDMFVIVAALGCLSPKQQELPLPDRLSLMLKHAGVSITVTSITDVVAFGIGATTVLPALKSFCVFACIGVLGLYVFSATFFVACISFDIRRKEDRRNACLCCFKHSEEYKPNNCSQRELIPWFLKKIYAPFLLKLPVKICVLVITAALLGVSIWGVTELKQDFDPSWFLPTDSYAYTYFGINDKYFPTNGVPAAVYCKNINYRDSKTKFEQLYTKMTTNNPYISSGTVDSWFKSFTDYLSASGTAYPNTEANFISSLYNFVTTQPEGLRHRREISFTNSNTDIDATFISFTHVNLDGTTKQIESMEKTQQMIKDIFTEGECFAYARNYQTYETNRVIQNELYRNLGIAAACVFVVTLILIAHLGTSVMVFTCVIATLVDVGGMMHFWGLTIDTVSSIQLILAIGLAVDYSAHIGHCFMTVNGTKNERVKATLVEIGAPVFSGGFSTFLAFVLLAGSNSYVFTTFFKVFFLVVVFGLFHGLAYLPTILSWLGPSPYLSADRRYESESELKEVKPDRNGGIDNAAFQRRNDPPPDYDAAVPYIPPPDYTPPVPRRPQSRPSGFGASSRGHFPSQSGKESSN